MARLCAVVIFSAFGSATALLTQISQQRVTPRSTPLPPPVEQPEPPTVTAPATPKPASASLYAQGVVSEEFVQFTKRFGRTYEHGSAEFFVRQSAFARHASAVILHNKRGWRTWDAMVTDMADYSDEELSAIRGFKPGSSTGTRNQYQLALSAAKHSARYYKNITQPPRCVSWTHLKAVVANIDHDQGSCGSCWAFSSSKMMEAQAELHNQARTFSPQQLVSCVENPDKCGGTGGCQGATATLALDYMMSSSIETKDSIPYMGRSTRCSKGNRQSPATFNLREGEDGELSHTMNTPTSFGLLGWRKLPQSSHALKLALYTDGPVAISVSATYEWNIYWKGIMTHDACPKDATVNHAVVAVGYGRDKNWGVTRGMEYWDIMNSWGPWWGENGHVRIKIDDECGTDYEPLAGSGCVDTAPKTVPVCGTCGVLIEAIVPIFADDVNQKMQAEATVGC